MPTNTKHELIKKQNELLDGAIAACLEETKDNLSKIAKKLGQRKSNSRNLAKNELQAAVSSVQAAIDALSPDRDYVIH